MRRFLIIVGVSVVVVVWLLIVGDFQIVQVDPDYREAIWFGYCINGRLDGICG